MRFIFQHGPSLDPHTFPIGLAALGSQWSKKLSTADIVWFGLVWSFGFYDISTFEGYLMPNPFLCK